MVDIISVHLGLSCSEQLPRTSQCSFIATLRHMGVCVFAAVLVGMCALSVCHFNCLRSCFRNLRSSVNDQVRAQPMQDHCGATNVAHGRPLLKFDAPCVFTSGPHVLMDQLCHASFVTAFFLIARAWQHGRKMMVRSPASCRVMLHLRRKKTHHAFEGCSNFLATIRCCEMAKQVLGHVRGGRVSLKSGILR